MPHLPPIGGHERRPFGKVRLVVYVVLAVVLAWLLLWSRVQSTKILQQSAADTGAYQETLATDFGQYLATQPTSATELTTVGLAAVEYNPWLASIWLAAAAERDPKYRDGVLGAGFAELKLAEAHWTIDAHLAQEHTETAQHYLEAARTIDPIYAYTYELLAIAYTNLGQAELAADATHKAEVFAARES